MPPPRSRHPRPDQPTPRRRLRRPRTLSPRWARCCRLSSLPCLARLAIFGRVLESNAAGFQILGQAVQLLAAVVAPVLLPIVLTLAAALLHLSDEIAGSMIDQMKSMARFMFGTVLPVLSLLADIVSGVVNHLKLFGIAVLAAIAYMNPLAAGLVGLSAVILSIVKSDGGVLARTVRDPVMKEGGGVDVGKTIDKLFGELTGKGGDEKGKGDDDKRSSLDDVLASFRLSLGPKAQFTGLAQVGQASQLAALNGDPIQQKMLAAMIRTADALEGVRADMRAKGGVSFDDFVGLGGKLAAVYGTKD